MSSVPSVEVSNPFHIILLENEPILNEIEQMLTLTEGTFKFIQRHYVTCEDSSLLRHCLIVLKKIVDKYHYFIFKVKIEMKYTVEMVMAHLKTITEICSMFQGLKAMMLPTQPEDDIYEIVIYSKENSKGIQLFSKTLSKINVFSSYYELAEIPEFFKSKYNDITKSIQQNYFSTIPREYDNETPPVVFGFEHNFKPFLQLMTKLQRDIFPSMKLKPTKAITNFHKAYYEERFDYLITNSTWDIKDMNYKTNFIETKHGIFDAYVKSTTDNVKKVAARVTEFLNGIVLVTVMEKIKEQDEKDLIAFSRINSTPFNSLYMVHQNKTLNK
ncbi:Caldesmon [Entamoeba marina]